MDCAMKNRTAQLVAIFVLTISAFSVNVANAEASTSLPIAAMASARSQNGAHYVWGAAGGYSKGYDCSGLTQWAYKQHGYKLPRTAQQQYNSVHHYSPSHRKPGDLIFILDAGGHVYHVGIYTGFRNGRGWMVNANYGRTTAHKVGEWPVQNYTAGPSYARYGSPVKR